MGAHAYGEAAAAFGGGRGHQGQDVFAECGTPLVAARGGKVEFKQFQSRAGNYLVIDGARTGVDYAYMHLRDPALVDKGDKVTTGQLIGYVGDTGPRLRLPPPLRGVDGAGLVRGRVAVRPAPGPAGLGRAVLGAADAALHRRHVRGRDLRHVAASRRPPDGLLELREALGRVVGRLAGQLGEHALAIQHGAG